MKLKGKGWITTPEVIELLFNMKAFQPGDEFVFAMKVLRRDGGCGYPCDCAHDDHRIANAFQGKRAKLLKFDDEDWDYLLLENAGDCRAGYRGSTTFHPHRFAAWRRPSGRKKT